MHLSTRSRYGTRAMLELALNGKKQTVNLKDIAEKQQISVRYLGHLFVILKSANLVRSVRGARGGYRLAKHPSQIRLSEIVRTLEGTLSPSECVDDPHVCPRSSFCVASEIWTEMRRSVECVLESYTLQDLVDRHRARVALTGAGTRSDERL